MVNDATAIRSALRNQLTLPKYQAGRIFGWGRRATDQAVKAGQLPVIDGPKQSVSTEWIRKQLQIEHPDT
jgi:hypothetical protein